MKNYVDLTNPWLEIDPSKVNFKRWKDKEVPFLFDMSDIDEEIITRVNDFIINYDMIASTFYLLSGFQELDASKRDSLGRLEFDQSIQYKLGIVKIPVVSPINL